MSFSLIALLLVFCDTPHKLLAQSGSLEFLSSYTGSDGAFRIESIVYSDPYYILIGRKNGIRTGIQYIYQNSEFIEHSSFAIEARIDGSDYWLLRSADAGHGESENSHIISLVYRSNDVSQFYIQQYNENRMQSSTYYDTIDGGSTIQSAHLDGNRLYLLNGRVDQSLIRIQIPETGGVLQIDSYPIPFDLRVSDFAVMNGGIVMIDGLADDRNLLIGPEAGVARATIDEANQLVIEDNRYFSSEIIPIPNAVLAKGDLLLVSRRNEDRLAPSSQWYEIKVARWLPGLEPETLGSMYGLFYSTTVDRMSSIWENRFAVQQNSSELSETVLYEIKDNSVQPVRRLEGNIGYVALGREALIYLRGGDPVALDLTHPDETHEFRFPIKPGFDPARIVLLGEYAVTIHLELDTPYLTLFDASDPANLIPLERHALSPDDTVLNLVAVGDRIAVVTPSDLMFFHIQSEGPNRLQPIEVTGLPASVSVMRYGTIRFDGNTMVVPYIATEQSRSWQFAIFTETSSGYERTGYLHAIPEDIALIDYQLFENHLYTFTSILEITEEGRPNYINTMTVYELSDAGTVNRIAELYIPNLENETGHSPLLINDSRIVRDGSVYLVFASSQYTQTIDIKNPSAPILLDTVLPGADRLVQAGHFLGLIASDRLNFYEPERELNQVFSYELPYGQSDVETKTGGDLLFTVSQHRGLEAYRMNLPADRIDSWQLHESGDSN